MHKNSKSYKTKVAALKKARAALKRKRALRPKSLYRGLDMGAVEKSLYGKSAFAAALDDSDYVRTNKPSIRSAGGNPFKPTDLLFSTDDGKSLTEDPSLRVEVRERVRKLVLAELDALLA